MRILFFKLSTGVYLGNKLGGIDNAVCGGTAKSSKYGP